MEISSRGSRIALDVADPGVLVRQLSARGGVFVPTRLPLRASDSFWLALRLRGVRRSLEVLARVVGPRVPRGATLLSAGLFARVAEPESPILDLLREYAAGRIRDVELRVQELVRIPVHVRFASTADARVELRALLNGPAQLPVNQPVERGDRLALSIETDQDGFLGAPHVLVRGVSALDGRRICVATLLEGQRGIVERALARGHDNSARA